jgi:hypothetical protein
MPPKHLPFNEQALVRDYVKVQIPLGTPQTFIPPKRANEHGKNNKVTWKQFFFLQWCLKKPITCSGEVTYSHVNKTKNKWDLKFESPQYKMGKY